MKGEQMHNLPHFYDPESNSRKENFKLLKEYYSGLEHSINNSYYDDDCYNMSLDECIIYWSKNENEKAHFCAKTYLKQCL